MFKIATPTGTETHTINFLETWASYKEDGFLKNFLIEGSKLAMQARNGDIPLETLLFYIETLQTIISKK